MLSFDAAGFERQLENALREIEHEVERAAEEGERAVAERALEVKQEEVETLYAQPTPRGSRRTGAWREGQQLVRNGDVLEVRTVGPAEEYEPYIQHPAAQRARERMEEEAPDVFERAVEDAMRGVLD